MTDSASTRNSDIETMLEELDKLASDMTEDKFSFVFNNIRMKADGGDSESTRIIDAMTAFHKALKRGESMEEICERSTAQPHLQQIIIDYIHAMQHIVLASKSL